MPPLPIASNLSRRDFLKMAALSATAMAAQACAGSAPAAPAPQAEAATPAPAAAAAQPAAPGQYNESPLLKARVDAGELPPVGERLPPAPEVITPIDEVGEYGGTVHVAIGNPNALFGDPQAVMGTELILRIDSDFSTIVGGLAESWEFNEDATEQILHLRQGLKWSDGQPFTSADFIFAWHDIQLNEEYRPAGPANAWRVGPERIPLTMEALDDYTLKLTFAEPYPLVILYEGFYDGAQGGLWEPSHYAKQFHPAYADAGELEVKIEEAGFENWTQLYADRMRMGSTIPAQVGLPGMTPFMRIADDPDHHTYERNPYYWKVDTAGNQLPYIDQAIISIIADGEVINARLIAGELDLVGRNAQLKNMELYQSSLETADLKLYMWNSTFPGKTIYYPNLTSKDPDLRAFFQNKDVRHALSLGLNREDINQAIHFGLGEPRQWAMWPSSKYYQEGDETHWADFDSEQANALLDQAGYDQRDNDNFRLFPSGKRLGWVAQYDSEQPAIGPSFELVREFWLELGIDMQLKPINRSLLEQLIAANDIDMTAWEGDISDITWPTFPRVMLPGLTNAKWGRAWELWLFNEGESEFQEEPPEEIKQVYNTWVAMRSTADEAEHLRLARELWTWYYDYLPAFSDVGVPQPVLMKKNLMNFSENGSWGFSSIRAVPIHPEQFFFKQPA